ncbi:MAG: ribonuclease III [Aminobacteriaceae bacterium]
MNYEEWYTHELKSLQERTGYRFKDEALLRVALTHSSFMNEQGGSDCNERLEFLGDSVLQLCVSRYLYTTREELDEGALTRRRSAFVCGASLKRWSAHLGLPRLLRTGKSLYPVGAGSSLCADVVEALFAAVFLDGGFEAAGAVVKGYLDYLAETAPSEAGDSKSSLQILAQEKGLGNPLYETLSVTGPSHEPVFQVRVLLGGIPAGEGSGPSKKAAEFCAAGEAYANLSKETEEI